MDCLGKDRSIILAAAISKADQNFCAPLSCEDCVNDLTACILHDIMDYMMQQHIKKALM